MKIMAIDYGDAHTGIAISDYTETLAGYSDVLHSRKQEEVLSGVRRLIAEHDVKLLVLGYPRNMDGTEGERAEKSRKLGKTLQIWSGLPVRMWDERQSTCEAADILDEVGTFGAHRKAILDSVSATVILEDYLAWRKEHPGEI